MSDKLTPLLITPGDPAGIGPDVTLAALQHAFKKPMIVIADPEMLAERAALLNLPCHINILSKIEPKAPHEAGKVNVYPCKIVEKATPGRLNVKNAAYVLNTLELAVEACLQGHASGIVTGPVQKACINQAGFHFTGHTEFLKEKAGVETTVMLFVIDALKVALATTHMSLKEVPKSITKTRLVQCLTVLMNGLKEHFNIAEPTIHVAGLNPHAGESGELGREEIEIIAPAIAEFKKSCPNVSGPFAADTIFNMTSDAILAMYHDQALPVIKKLGFDRAVNVTLGLPFIRTSVDHGTALSLAGTNQANPGSMLHAIQLACELSDRFPR